MTRSNLPLPFALLPVNWLIQYPERGELGCHHYPRLPEEEIQTLTG